MTRREISLDTADRWRTPAFGAPRVSRFKEWQHFNICLEPGLEIIINFSMFSPFAPGGEGGVNVIVLAHEGKYGWNGGVERHDFEAFSRRRESARLSLPGASLSCEGGIYEIIVGDEGDAVRALMRLTPQCRPFTARNNVPIGGGHINWLVVANLRVEGEFIVRGRRYDLDGARGYHDHNWGAWLWGERFGWDWGYCSDLCRVDGEPVSLVYDRTLDRSGARVFEHTLAFWVGDRLATVFTRDMIKSTKGGRFAGEVLRSPPVMNLLRHDRVGSVPAVVTVSAEDGADRIELEYRTDAARRVAIPMETGFGSVALDETLGWLTVRGQLGGRPIEGRRRTCFEFLG